MRLYERAQWFVTAKDIDYEFASRSKGILQSVVANLIDSLEEEHRPVPVSTRKNIRNVSAPC